MTQSSCLKDCVDMIARTTLLLVLAAAMPAWSQVEPSATGDNPASLDDSQMMMPAPVSGMPYPNKAASDERSGYLTAGIAVHGANVDNVLPGITAKPANDFTYSVLPTFSFERTTTRQEATLSYNPSFIFYEPDSQLDTVDQGASMVYEYRFSPSVAVSAQDYFVRTSNVFDQSFSFSQAGITGSTQLPTPALIAPFAEQLTDNCSGNVSYQFGRNGMVGAGGNFAIFDLPNSSQATGLYNSHSGGGSAFYSRRFTSKQYAGFVYQYDRVIASPANSQSETQTHLMLPFYTVYFSRTFSLSISAGAQHLDVSQTPGPTTTSWQPAAVVSMGWQGARGDFAAGYSRTITSGGGLLGAYNTTSVNAGGGWKFTPTWTASLGAAYSIIKDLTPLTAASIPGGHAILGNVSISREMGEHFNVGVGYERLHEDYTSVAVIAADPDSDQEFVTVTYQWKRALGR